MDGKITKNGRLEIKRGKQYKDQVCPFFNGEMVTYCGDECPLFGEPAENIKYKTSAGKQDFNEKKTSLKICQDRELEFDEFEDMRERK
jgi:hypothetical protein